MSSTTELREQLIERVLLDRIGWDQPLLGHPDFGVALVNTLSASLAEWVHYRDFTPVSLADLLPRYRQRVEALPGSEQLRIETQRPRDNPALPSRIEVGEIERGQQRCRFGWWADASTEFRARRDVSLMMHESYPDWEQALGQQTGLVLLRRVARADTWFSSECVLIPPQLMVFLNEIEDQDLQLQPHIKRKKIVALPDSVGGIHVRNTSPTTRMIEIHLKQSACRPLWEIHFPENPRPGLASN
jgi:hypothetical protein